MVLVPLHQHPHVAEGFRQWIQSKGAVMSSEKRGYPCVNIQTFISSIL